MIERTSKFLLLLLTAGCLAAYADPTLVLDPPGGAAVGTPGQTVGWGFAITNDTAYYLLFDNSYFCQAGQDPLLTTCTQSLGTYQDYIANNGTEIAPGSPAVQTFDANAMTGFGAYTINPTASLGEMDSGNLIATYMEYEGDPYNGGTQVSGDIEISAAASVTVIGAATVPEPASWMMLAAGLAAVGATMRKVKRERES